MKCGIENYNQIQSEVDMQGVTVSQATRLTEYQLGKINFLYAPVGAGKTFYFLKTLPEELGIHPNKTYIFIAPYKSIVDQTLSNDEAEHLSTDVRLSFENVIPIKDAEKLALQTVRGKVLVMTAQSFFAWTYKVPDAWKQIDTLVIDECDAIEFEMANFSTDSHFRQFKSRILAQCATTRIILTTATRLPHIRKSYLQHLNEILFAQELRHFVPKSIVGFGSMGKVLDKLFPPRIGYDANSTALQTNKSNCTTNMEPPRQPMTASQSATQPKLLPSIPPNAHTPGIHSHTTNCKSNMNRPNNPFIATQSKCNSVANGVVIYTPLVRNCIAIKNELENRGYVCAVMVSENAKNYTHSEFDLLVRSAILNETELPTHLDCIIFNDAFVRGVNITDEKFGTIIVNSTDPVKQTQAIGRLRFDGIEIHKPMKEEEEEETKTNTQIINLEEYIGIELLKEQTKELIMQLNLRDSKNRLIGIIKFKEWLAHYSYELKTKKVVKNKKNTTVYFINKK